jgi:hypothetical protein
VLLPVVIGFVAFGTAWATGLATFAGPLGTFFTTLLVAGTVGTVGGAVSAAGEEIGWRGYMLTRLIDAGIPAPVIVSGLIWGLWHVPLIVTGIIYGASPPRALAVVVFMVSATSAGVVIARFRLETGSIWPPIALQRRLQQCDPDRVHPGRGRTGCAALGRRGGGDPRRGRAGRRGGAVLPREVADAPLAGRGVVGASPS